MLIFDLYPLKGLLPEGVSIGQATLSLFPIIVEVEHGFIWNVHYLGHSPKMPETIQV